MSSTKEQRVSSPLTSELAVEEREKASTQAGEGEGTSWLWDTTQQREEQLRKRRMRDRARPEAQTTQQRESCLQQRRNERERRLQRRREAEMHICISCSLNFHELQVQYKQQYLPTLYSLRLAPHNVLHSPSIVLHLTSPKEGWLTAPTVLPQEEAGTAWVYWVELGSLLKQTAYDMNNLAELKKEVVNSLHPKWREKKKKEKSAVED